MTEVVLFLIVSGIIFWSVRKGIAGVRIEKPLPALALSSLFGLGITLIVTALIAGSTAAGTDFALIYIVAGTLLAGYLWYSGVMNRRFILAMAGLSTLTGFVFLAPIMPMELGSVINVLAGTSAATYGVIVICSVIALALILGRTFCGHICPVGSLQELAYAVPVNRITVRHTRLLEIVRVAVFAASAIAAVYLIDLMAVTGLYDLFSLTLSAGFAIAATLIVISVFVYRPVCRILCPFGVLFSLFAEFAIFRIRRNSSCISCRKCETACPACTAGREDPKRECYLCGRCTDVCPKTGAISYRH